MRITKIFLLAMFISNIGFSQVDISVTTNHVEVQLERFFGEVKMKYRGNSPEFGYVLDKQREVHPFPSVAAAFDYLENQGFIYVTQFNIGRGQSELFYIFRRKE